MGLGLSISYLLSKKLGRSLEVDSLYGQGTIMGFKVRDYSEIIDSPDLEKMKIYQIEEERSLDESPAKLLRSNNFELRKSFNMSSRKNSKAFGLMTLDLTTEYNCILFESICNENIQEK